MVKVNWSWKFTWLWYVTCSNIYSNKVIWLKKVMFCW